MATPEPPARGDEARDALAAVLSDQKERAVRRDQATHKPKDTGPAQTVAAFALLGLTVWVWVSPPTVVRPPPPPPIAAPVADASLRLTVYQAVMAVQAFHVRTGVLPGELDEVFPDPVDRSGLTYQRLDFRRFRLTGLRGDRAVMYETGDSISGLLGNARQMLEGGP